MQAMTKYLIIMSMILLLGCDGTPFKYKNHIQVPDAELSEIKESLEDAIVHYNKTRNDFVPYYADKELRIEFVDLFFNDTKDKVVFTIIDTVKVREGTQIAGENGFIYSTFGFSGKKNGDNSWELNQIKASVLILRYSSSHSKAKKDVKYTFRHKMDTYAYPSGRIPYKYNIDDIRIFDGPLFQDSVSVRSGD